MEEKKVRIISAKGEMTRQRILETSKKLFYERGYKDVSMRNIAQQCNIAGGNLTYYFATKQEVADCILTDFYLAIMKYVRDYFPEMDRVFDRHFYNSMIFNIVLFRNENYMRFYREILDSQRPMEIFSKIVEHVYLGIMDEFHLRITQIQYKFILIADSGQRRESFITLYDEKMNIPPKDYSLMVYEITSRLFGVPYKEFVRSAYDSYRKVDDMFTEQFKLL